MPRAVFLAGVAMLARPLRALLAPWRVAASFLPTPLPIPTAATAPPAASEEAEAMIDAACGRIGKDRTAFARLLA